ncbi:choice-of-anchor J family PEP-CTERM protein [Telluria aromaticivorans]|uniref:PEP-CTERM sorting domain-containing protein n=1 Tax=Telluria aromaticivorans TaxID=2725995 RepID=A0A7Y2K177_9BURK|nr:choice-of-anchor J domain-containing protein [Telluria aromaticivorans]NNG23539.1 PEP-CTERM sorting domain-containing protein [Telluria aromaticivorans]
MNRLTSLSGAVLLAAAAVAPLPGHAAELVVLNEGFRNVANLSDWAQINRSVPPGTGWFQGNTDVFTSYNGPDNAYIAANYLNAANGMGVVDNWLITPTLTLNGLSTLSFHTNRSGETGFFDQLEVRFGFGSNTSADGFDTLLLTIGGDLTFPSDWARWTTNLDVQGEGRFAFRFLGDAATLDYVGLDAVRVVTAVPEPSSWLMLLAGLGAVGATARRLRK